MPLRQLIILILHVCFYGTVRKTICKVCIQHPKIYKAILKLTFELPLFELPLFEF